jgi:hypothetical protein
VSQNRLSTWIELVNHEVKMVVGGLLIRRTVAPKIETDGVAGLRVQHELSVNFVVAINADADRTSVFF